MRARIDDFIIDVDAKLRALDGRLAPPPDEDAMVDLIRVALTRVGNTRSADKRARFRNIIVHQLLVAGSVDDAEAAVDLLDRLSDIDVAVLGGAVTDPNLELPDGVRVVCLQRLRSKEPASATLSDRFPDVPLENLILACAKLVANGLLLDEGVGRFDCGALEYLRGTDLAAWFIAWIRDQTP